MSYLSVFLFTVSISTIATSPLNLSLPNNTDLVLPIPEPCQEGVYFCENNILDYEFPHQLQEAIESVWSFNVTSPLTFGSSSPSTQSPSTNSGITSACRARTAKLPLFGRSVNKYGKWKYVLQGVKYNAGMKVDIDITICENAGKACINDADSPNEGGSTVCRQAYRYERLLAVDENGEVSIDNFPLPSACLCHYDESDQLRMGDNLLPYVRSSFIEEDLCIEEEIMTLKRKRRESEINHNNDDDDDFRITFPDDYEVSERIQVSPCSNNSYFCSEESIYSDEVIDDIVIQSSKASSKIFRQLYSQPCQGSLDNKLVLKQVNFNAFEEPLCSSKTEYAFPKKGINVEGKWRNIVNTETFQQGVSMETCQKGTENMSCLYAGSQGKNPEATTCKQIFTLHPMVVIENEKVFVEMFQIPSACVCYLVNPSDFF